MLPNTLEKRQNDIMTFPEYIRNQNGSIRVHLFGGRGVGGGRTVNKNQARGFTP